MKHLLSARRPAVGDACTPRAFGGLPRSMIITAVFLFVGFSGAVAQAQVVTLLLDSTGDGNGNILDGAFTLATDFADNVYVCGAKSDNVFKVTPSGTITEIIDASGDGQGHTLDYPASVVADGAGNIYVAGSYSSNVFKITPGGVITQIIDASGDGNGNVLSQPSDIAVDSPGNLYVSGESSNNVFKITPQGLISQILDATGDGNGNGLSAPRGIAVDSSGNVFVSGMWSHNVFRVAPDGTVTQVVEMLMDGFSYTFSAGIDIAIDAADNVYIASFGTPGIYMINSAGWVSELLPYKTLFLGRPQAIAADPEGFVFAVTDIPPEAFMVSPYGVKDQILQYTTWPGPNGTQIGLDSGAGIAVDSQRSLYVSGFNSDNVLKVESSPCLNGVVDAGEVCDPSAPGSECCRGTCDAMASSGDTCRLRSGLCDAEETCSGSSLACPPDLLAVAGSVCRQSLGACDQAETCDGVSNDCPADLPAAAGTVCRASVGVCDLTESCDGISNLCPADLPADAGAVCRASVGACDVAEHCDGIGSVCPPDSVFAAGIECRSSAGACDPAESCDGSSGLCPVDAKSTAECRPASAACDSPESCNGVSNDCPADLPAAAGTVCRASVGACDLAETCDGMSWTCPADSSAADGTTCDDATFCNGADTCVGGACLGHAGDPCLPLITVDSNCAQSCNEVTKQCSATDPDGSGCSDGDSCTVSDSCQSGICTPGAQMDCDDANPCTVDTCDSQAGSCNSLEQPDPACKAAESSSLSIVSGARHKLAWKWRQAKTAAPGDFGFPVMTTSYDVCLYDTANGSYSVATRLSLPSSLQWRLQKTGRWKYKDGLGLADGIRNVVLQTIANSKTKIMLKADGANLPAPLPVIPPAAGEKGLLFNADPVVVLQLSNSEGVCWIAEFDAPSRNTGTGFKAKLRR